MPKIDEAQYTAGKEAFASGGTIRSVVERMLNSGHSREVEELEMSFIVGFADAFLERLRR